MSHRFYWVAYIAVMILFTAGASVLAQEVATTTETGTTRSAGVRDRELVADLLREQRKTNALLKEILKAL